MPDLDLAIYSSMPTIDLESRRRAIVTKAAGSHDNLSLEDLHELAAITGVLRRKASGPPKAAKPTKEKRVKAGPISLDDLV